MHISSCIFALKRDTEERSFRDEFKYRKSTTQNTEGELYVRIVKREIILNWGSGKQSPLKKHYSHSVIGDKE